MDTHLNQHQVIHPNQVVTHLRQQEGTHLNKAVTLHKEQDTQIKLEDILLNLVDILLNPEMKIEVDWVVLLLVWAELLVWQEWHLVFWGERIKLMAMAVVEEWEGWLRMHLAL